MLKLDPQVLKLDPQALKPEPQVLKPGLDSVRVLVPKVRIPKRPNAVLSALELHLVRYRRVSHRCGHVRCLISLKKNTQNLSFLPKSKFEVSYSTQDYCKIGVSNFVCI